MLRKLFIVFGIIISVTSFSQESGKSQVAPELVDLFSPEKNNEVACYRIPALITAPNGDLIAAIDERVPSCADLRGNGDINIVIRRSADNGITWTETARIIDFPEGQSASDPSMIADKITGEIFMFYNFMDLKKEKDVYYFHFTKSKDNGSWMINSRMNGEGKRFVHVSTDEGKTWETKAAPQLVDPGCNASIIRYTSVSEGYAKNRLLFVNAKSNSERVNLSVRISYDEGHSWTEGKTIYEGSSAYSSLTILENGDIGLLFERDDYSTNTFIKFSLNWLTDGADSFK